MKTNTQGKLHLNGQNVKTEDGRNIYVGDKVSDENKQLAALIVRAANEHAALIAVAEAVQDMRHDIEIFYSKHREAGNRYKVALDAALSTLANIRKGAQ